MEKRIVLFVLFFSFSLIFVRAQRLNMEFHDPLKDLSITSTNATDLIQDSDGIIWIATRDGLNSFNGVETTQYVNDPLDTTSLVHNNILSLFEDSSGKLWIATNHGLCQFDPLHNNFIQVITEEHLNGVNSAYIVKVVEDQQQGLYVASENGLFLFDVEKSSFNPLLKLDKGEISEVLFDEDNNIWISSVQGGGLNFYDRKSKALRPIQNFKGAESLSINEFRDIVFFNGKLWMASYGEGIYSYDLSLGLLKQYPVESDYQKFASFAYVDNDHRLWTCDLTGLKLYDEELDVFYGYYAEETENNNLKKNAIGIYQDHQNNYWSIHNPGGVGLRTVRRGIELYNTNPEWYWHTMEDNITAISSDEKGNWWIGNQYNGIDMFEWEKGKITTYTHNTKGNLGPGTVFAIFSDSEQKMWVGSHMGGLQYFNPSDSSFYSYKHDPNNPSSIANNDVRSITEDKEGNLWMVVHGKGVDKFDKQTKLFTHFNNEQNNLSNNWTFKVFMDAHENLWVASSWGLSKLTKGEERFKVYFTDATNPKTISDNEVNDIFEDKKGQIWIATAKGLCKYNSATDDFTRYSQGLRNSFVCAIQEDVKGNLWVSTHKGIIRFDPELNNTMYFDEFDGVQQGEFNRGTSYYNTDEGLIFFGGIHGVNYFSPEKLFFNTTPPKVILTKLNLFNSEVIPGDETGILQFDITYSDRIILDYGQNVIGLEYAALNMINPEKNKYKYMLEGFDKEWVDAGTKKIATYTNLNPGNYILRVIASNNDQVWNTEGVSLTIIVRPPWWMTWWFRVLAALFLVVFVAVIFYVRTERLRNQKMALEKMVEDRTLKLNEKNQLLKQQTEDLNEINALLEERTQKVEEQSSILAKQTKDLTGKNNELEKLNITKDKLFSIIAHDLKNPFQAILSLSDMFYSKFDKLSEEDKIKMSEYINNSSKTVYNLLENLLNWARSQSDQIVFRPTELDIYELINENVHLLQKSANNKEIQVDVLQDSEIKVFGDKDMLNTVLRNIINNAIKFTDKGGKVNISVRENDQFAEVVIADNGIGMEKDVLNSLFTIDKKNSRQGTSGEKGSALGLVLCKDFVERNGGTIMVKSEDRKGSIFSFTIPLSSAHTL